MNIRRGLFRLWIVLSGLYVTVIAGVSFEYVFSEFRRAGKYEQGLVRVPVKCGRARGVENSDYHISSFAMQKNLDDSCWYSMAAFRRLYPEYVNTTNSELIATTFTDAGEEQYLPKPWVVLQERATWAIAPPVVLFVVGFLFLWAFAGFSRPTPKP